MQIHTSYNKKDLCHIIETFSLGIDYDHKINNRDDIRRKLQDYINKYEIEELYFLNEENKITRLSVKEKNEILASAKKIISFCKNGYNIERSLYKDYYEILCEVKNIAKYGDISSVRRALKLFNIRHEPSVEIFISENIKLQLEQKKLLKKLSIPVLQCRQGTFLIEF